MPRYKTYTYAQGRFIPVYFEKQIIPGAFEYSLNQLVDHELYVKIFNTWQIKSKHALEPLLHCAQFNKDLSVWGRLCLTDGHLELKLGVIRSHELIQNRQMKQKAQILYRKIN